MRASTTFALLAAPLLAAAVDEPTTSNKRGLCYVTCKDNGCDDNASDDSIWDGSDSDLTWYYNYEAKPTSIYNGKLEFVPQQWGKPDSDDSMDFYNSVKDLKDGGMNINWVLGFNEPDGCGNGGSCVTAEDAAKTWIREIEPLKKLGIKLVAPAVTSAPTGFTWMQNFFTACDGKCTPEAIAVHYYGAFQGLADHLGQVNGTYPNMTTWITEFADPDVSLDESQDFYKEATDYFDRLEYVTHYSYFGAFRSDKSNVGKNAAMLTQKGELTDIGAWYLGQAATGNKPKGGAAQMTRFAGSALVVLAAGLYLVL